MVTEAGAMGRGAARGYFDAIAEQGGDRPDGTNVAADAPGKG